MNTAGSTAQPAPADGLPLPVERRFQSLTGALIGTAVGDALGLPMEGLSAARQQKLFPLPLRHRFAGHFGMLSDDTEHTVMIAQAILTAPDDPIAFQRCLARKFRWWLIALPAGVGFATLRAILKLWVGVPPSRSGVVSAGNGPAMRSAVLGIYFADDAPRRLAFVRASAQLTHLDPRAEIAALAVAETAAWMTEQQTDSVVLVQQLAALSDLPEWTGITTRLQTVLARGGSTAEFARELGITRGVSGYAFQSVPVAIYAALRHREDLAIALGEVIACGGDTDTTGAITGALVGARVCTPGIPAAWREQFLDWPRSIPLLRRIGTRLARQLEAGGTLGPVRYFWPAIPFRNLVFLAVVLAHGLRRLLPPY